MGCSPAAPCQPESPWRADAWQEVAVPHRALDFGIPGIQRKAPPIRISLCPWSRPARRPPPARMQRSDGRPTTAQTQALPDQIHHAVSTAGEMGIGTVECPRDLRKEFDMTELGVVRWFEDLSVDDVALVGGKNASLGEMIRNLSPKGIRVPGGFAIVAHAYWKFLDANNLREPISEQIGALHRGADLAEVGDTIRRMIMDAEFPEELAEGLRDAYRELGSRLQRENPDVAVRSSATAEDLPEASFAGQQETFLNVTGETALLDACKRCYASLFTDRAISYRQDHDFDHLKVALAIGVPEMVRSDRAGAGEMFSIETDSRCP